MNISEALDKCRQPLIDTGGRSRLINFPLKGRKTKQWLRIINEDPGQVFDRLVIQNKDFLFAAAPDEIVRAEQSLLGDEPAELLDVDTTDNRLQTARSETNLDSTLQNISRRAKSFIDETGVNMLYLALGILEWYESDSSDDPKFAPLLLLPASLRKKYDERSRKYVYRLNHTGEEIQANLSLAKRMETDFGFRIPVFEDGQSPEEYFDSVREVVDAHQPRWVVRNDIILAFFSFQKQLLYLDLDPANWTDSKGRIANSQIKNVFEGVEQDDATTVRFEDIDIDHSNTANRTLVVVDADSSQHSALCDIEDRYNLVIEGPPGTGKSQTIINAIASAIASGKTVLFVAEKLVALKVVHDRLDKLGLADFCLNLHSDQATPRSVCSELESRLEKHKRYTRPAQIDSVRRDLLQKRDKLAAYLDAIGQKVGPLELPLSDVFWRLAEFAGRDVPLLRISIDPTMPRQRFNESQTVLSALAKHIEELGTPLDCPWWGFECADLDQVDIPDLRDHIDIMHGIATSLANDIDRFRELTGIGIDWFSTFTSLNSDVLSRLDDIPEDVDRSLARLLSDASRASAAEDLLDELNTFSDLERRAADACIVDWSQCVESARKVQQIWKSELHKAFESKVSITDVTSWRARLDNLLSVLDEVATVRQQLRGLGFDDAATPSQFERERGIYRLINDEIAANSDAVTEKLFLASAEQLYLQATERRDEISRTESKVGKVFSVPDLPDRREISSLRQSIRPFVDSWHRLLWREYRKSKRRIQQFLALKVKFRPDLIVESLQLAESLLVEKDDFAGDQRLVGVLGQAFRGMDTDWGHIEHLLRWAKTLSARGIGGQRALSLISKCKDVSGRPRVSDLDELCANLRSELDSVDPKLLGASDRDRLDKMDLERMKSVVESRLASISSFLDAIQQLSHTPETPITELLSKCSDVIAASGQREAIDRSTRYRHAFPNHYSGIDTDAEPFRKSLATLKNLRPVNLPTAVLIWLFDAEVRDRSTQLKKGLGHFIKHRDAWFRSIDEFQRFGDCDPEWFGYWASDASAKPIHRLDVLRRNIDILPTWIAFCRARRRCGGMGLEPWLQAAADGSMSADQLTDSFDRTVHQAVANASIGANPVLRDFSRQEHEQVRSEFQQLDEDLIELQRKQVAWQASNREIPAGISKASSVTEYTQLGLLRNEIGKQRRHRPVRELVRRAGGAMLALKPCWMMSPLSVAQFIEPNSVVFDLLLMDEASQIKPEDALGSVARAEQVVVVGDDKQMPPSNWMQRIDGGRPEDDDENEETLGDDSESILEWANRAYRRVRRLKWHYRSEHESLIAFSNHEFYDNELIVFPAPGRKNDSLGLRFHHVADGRWAARQNVVEAQAVANAIVQHAVENDSLSLGVATFNQPQMTAIEEELNRMIESDASARRAVERLRNHGDELFIKNVENLQGDERDVILISYTYGPDETGRVLQGFYPINTEKGWRRFNVLVTRARKRIEVFSSMLPEQITATRSRGVRCMRDYLRYVRDGILVDTGAFTGRPPDSDFEVAVARSIRRMGFDVVAQVGVAGYFIDLAVRAPGRDDEFVLGIECDGATYHSAKSARDRDRLRQQVIEARGWTLHRVWSTDWFQNQATEERRLNSAIEAALTASGLVT